MIRTQNVMYHDEVETILESVSIDFPEGKTTIVSGPSGSGKTLLFSILAGIRKPTKGDVFLNQKSIYNVSDEHRLHLRRLSSVVFQVPAVISNLTVLENMQLAASVYYPHDRPAYQLDRIERTLTRFDLWDLRNSRPDRLSRGQLYNLALARALMPDAPIFMWDDPFVSLDPMYTDMVERQINLLKQEGKTLIFFTHRKRTIDNFGDVVFEIDDRKVVPVEV